MRHLQSAITGNLQRVFLLMLVLSSCEIEDDHGTPKFVAGLGENTTQHGELLTDYFIEWEFLVSEEKKSIFFVGCPSENRWCETRSLVSLNYETGEEKELFSINYQSWLILIPNQPVEHRLLFLARNDNSNSADLHAVDLDTYQDKIVVSLDASETRISSNQQHAIYNNGYDSYNIYRSDFNGNTKKLISQGEVLYAIPNISKVLIMQYNTWKYALYDYNLKLFDVKKESGIYYSNFYAYEDDLYGLEQSGSPAIRDFFTDEILFMINYSDQLLDFDPVNKRALVGRTNEIGIENNFSLIENELLVHDRDGLTIETGIRIYEGFISYGRILNDGKTIIYNSEGNLYLTSIE